MGQNLNAMRRVFAGIVAIATLLCAGCGSGSAPDTADAKKPTPLTPYVGTWSTNDDGLKITLTVLEAGSFTVAAEEAKPATGKGEKHLVTGKAEVLTGRLSLVASEINGKPPTSDRDKEPQLFLLSKDGKTLESADGTKLTKE